MCSRVRAHQASDAGAGGSETRQRASAPRITNAWGAPARGMQAVATADEEPAGDVQRVTRDAPYHSSGVICICTTSSRSLRSA